MLRNSQRGTINVLLLPFIVAVLLFIGTLVFGYWAYAGRQDYKNNSDQKAQAAVAAAIKAEDAKKDAAYAEASKSPLKTFVGPSDYGSLHVSYPKTWSAYVDETNPDTAVVDGYFYPDFVPGVGNNSGTNGTAYALRVQILNQTYSDTLQALSNQVQGGTLSVTPYSLPAMKNVVGSRAEGSISQNKKGSMVILPLRDKTIQIWTEASQFTDDFNNIVLPSVSFSP